MKKPESIPRPPHKGPLRIYQSGSPDPRWKRTPYDLLLFPDFPDVKSLKHLEKGPRCHRQKPQQMPLRCTTGEMKTPERGWRDGSVVKSTSCSSRGHEFNSQQPHSVSQPSAINIKQRTQLTNHNPKELKLQRGN